MKFNFYNLNSIISENTEEEFKKKSIELAQLQRAKPEYKMLAVQKIMGGGILSPVVEHCGDLIHRANESVTWNSAGYEYVKDKVRKILRYLTNDYGFEKELEENIKYNAEYEGISIDAYKEKLYKSLEEYAEAHEELPAYNECQRTMKKICVSIGNRNWNSAVNYLKILKNYLTDKEKWVSFARAID
jgi:hypothetical protein